MRIRSNPELRLRSSVASDIPRFNCVVRLLTTLNALLRKQGAIDFPSEEIIRTALPSTVLQTLITRYLRPVSITSG